MKKTSTILSLVIPDIGSPESPFWKYRQRLADLFLVTCGVYYVGVLFYSLCILGVEEAAKTIEKNAAPAGMFKCVSVWTSILMSFFYITLNISNWVQKNYPPQHHLVTLAEFDSYILEKSFLSLVFPLSLYACSVFWCVFYVDRDLIYPKIIEETIPVWYNHVIHTLPEVLVFLHLLLVEHKSAPIPMGVSMIIQTTFHLAYFLLMYVYGQWFYKFLDHFYVSMTMTGQITLGFMLSIVVPNLSVWIGYKINAILQRIVSKVNNKNK